MKTFKVYGASDDLIEASGIDGCDEFDSHGFPYAGHLVIETVDASISVHCIYDGSWAFAVTSNDWGNDFRKMPDWEMRRTFGRDCEYSETLEIDVPDEATVLYFVEK